MVRLSHVPIDDEQPYAGQHEHGNVDVEHGGA